MSFVREWLGYPTLESDLVFLCGETHLVCINGKNDPVSGRRCDSRSTDRLGAIFPIKDNFKATLPTWQPQYHVFNGQYGSFDWYTVCIKSAQDAKDVVEFFLRDDTAEYRQMTIKSLTDALDK